MTVHDLAADGAELEMALGFRVKGGRVVWEGADYPEGSLMNTVRIHRIVPTEDNMHLRVIVRYVDPETVVTIVPVPK